MLTETGWLILNFADEIFSLSSELKQIMHYLPYYQANKFKVEVVDVIPKSIAKDARYDTDALS